MMANNRNNGDNNDFDLSNLNNENNSGNNVDNIVNDQSNELPKSLIITNMDIRIFNDSSNERLEFEKTFRQMDSEVKFIYFRSFRRARLDFSSNKIATKARIVSDRLKFGDEMINCYFAEISNTSSNDLLKPPALEKQFLISPPASPPEGWEPVSEAQPILNLDLQTALANILPGSAHELHPPSNDQPGIVVHICSDSEAKSTSKNNDGNDNDNVLNRATRFKPKITQTPCPPSMQKPK